MQEITQSDRLLRQLDLLSGQQLNKRILIVGAGAVGSFTALTLAKMGFHTITVMDFDTIDVANMNCQFYRTMDIGKAKTTALFSLVKSFTDIELNILPIKLEETTPLECYDIVISAVDSMSVRKLLWEKAKVQHLHFIDARMGGESILLYTMNTAERTDVKDYEKTLYTDENAVFERCTAKATMYTVNLIAGLIGKAVKDIATGCKAYTRIVMWNVKDNGYIGFNKEEQC